MLCIFPSRFSEQNGFSLSQICLHSLRSVLFRFDHCTAALRKRDCNRLPNKHKESSALGYFCNGVNRSCPTYLTFRSIPPYNNITAISNLLAANPSEISKINSVSENATFETNKLVIVPVNCSCAGEYYQSYASYVIRQHDIYLNIANSTFQGLTTCQALGNQRSNPPPRELISSETIVVPLRCACPTKNQVDMHINYLMSYLVHMDDDVSSISERFRIDNGLLLKANRLLELDDTIYPFTTLLVPLQSVPSSHVTIEPPPSSPPPSASSATFSSNNSTKKTWLYALLGAVGGCVFLFVFGTIIFCRVFHKSKRKNDHSVPVPIRSDEREKIEKECYDILENILDIAPSFKVYSFDELKVATNDFCPSCWIKGSVYRRTFNGDLAAIKKMDGDISKEINLLQKINHSNVIRLSGVCLDKGHWYLVYEYASNGPLSDWIFSDNNDGKSLTWTQRIQIALDVAKGLAYLHSFTNPPYVLVDIRSSNILLDSDFRAKIANFSLAESIQAQEGQFSLAKHIVGSLGYLAPEYLEIGLVSKKLDVYAFGVLLLEMLTGKDVSVLYNEEKRHLTDTLTSVLNDDGIESLRHFMDPSMGERYPAELANLLVRIVDSCLNKNPQIRPPMSLKNLEQFTELGIVK